MRISKLALLFGLTTVLWWPLEIRAEKCPTADAIQAELQYLRRLSLDLRGHLPSLEEMQMVIKNKKVPPSLIDKMLNSKEFIEQIREYHRDLLWGNISNLLVTSIAWRLVGDGKKVPLSLTSPGRRRLYRGHPRATCLNEPAQFDSDGNIIVKKGVFIDADKKKYTVYREGWVYVSPYWAMGTKVKVCAFDAQTNLEGKYHVKDKKGKIIRTVKVRCNTSNIHRAKECGCGKNLRWCHYDTRTISTSKILLQSLAEQTLRFIGEIVQKDRPYTEILLSKEFPVNGPIAHFLKYQRETNFNFIYARELNFTPPNLEFEQRDRWVTVTVPDRPRKVKYSGILTMPLYLLKFASNRGRAHRFFNAFLCTYFETPPGGIPPANDKCHAEPNLMKRCGCRYCHQTLEPATAYWGRWAEAGFAPLNPDLFPKKDNKCKDKKYENTFRCKRFYFTPKSKSDEVFRALLKSYVMPNRQEDKSLVQRMEKNIDEGPAGIARKAISSGDFARCTVKKIWTWLMGGPPHPQLKSKIDELAQQFAKNGYSLKKLIRTIVTSPEYRPALGKKKIK